MRKYVVSIISICLFTISSFVFANDISLSVFNDFNAGKTEKINEVINASQEYAPYVFYPMSNLLFEMGKKDKAVFWFCAAQLRSRFDANRCTDKTAASAVAVLNAKYGPEINKYMFTDVEKLKEIVNNVAEWDEATPYNYNPAWINAHGMKVFTKKGAEESTISKEQWKSVAKKTREDYLNGLDKVISFPNADLFYAISNGSSERVTEIINKKKVDLNMTFDCPHTTTPLILASMAGYGELVEILLANGADIDKLDKKGYTPLASAIMSHKNETVKLLIEKGADLNILLKSFDFDSTYFEIAVLSMNKEGFKILIDAGADVNLKNSRGRSITESLNLMSPIIKNAFMAYITNKDSNIKESFRPEEKKAALGELPPEIDEKKAKALSYFSFRLNTFRIKAASNPSGAIAKWADYDFIGKWSNEVIQYLNPANLMLQDFFATSIMFLGYLKENSVICAFYNPWIDGIMLVSVKRQSDEDILLDDFAFVAGETWRDETVTTGEDILKFYSTKDPLIVALAKRYAKVFSCFNKNYPLAGEGGMVTLALKEKLSSNQEELRPIVGRMIYRMTMFKAFMTDDNKYIIDGMKRFAELIKEGDKNNLKRFLSLEQDQEMLKSLCLLPAEFRTSFGPVYFGSGKNSSIVGLVNPSTPRWVIVAKIKKGDGVVRNIKFELFDLNLSKELLTLVSTKEGRSQKVKESPVIQRTKEIDSFEVTEYVNKGLTFVRRGKYDKAIAEFSSAIQLNPMQAVAYNNRGLAFSEKKDYDSALKDFNKAIEINPSYVTAYYNRGNLFFTKEEYDQAVVNYTKVITLKPSFARAYNNRALTFYEKSEFSKALDDVQMAKKLGYAVNSQFLRSLKLKVEKR